ncbi:mitochondrial transcription rescue factor 1 [Leguminivora glycinivorella]|uniref:mitochondrial transcription rescue factor 1 n=1 Tax=Leguminivora glycinivorella TaxID=1035111 RepID=UPI00200C4094|nr:mitochondrial transcription rescue factor 1 [Leguminivora glycinivorella]
MFLNKTIINPIWRCVTKPVLTNNIRQEVLKKFISTTVCSKYIVTTSLVPNKCQFYWSYNTIRHKSKKQRAEESDDEGDTLDDDPSLSRDSKVVKFNTTSLRTDLILKTALGVARNKIEQLFYESKIRVNGKKIVKKSLSVKIGDEIDIIKTVSPKNSDHLYISRIEVMNLTAKEETIVVTARRFKTLLIENYETDPYKGTANEE